MICERFNWVLIVALAVHSSSVLMDNSTRADDGTVDPTRAEAWSDLTPDREMLMRMGGVLVSEEVVALEKEVAAIEEEKRRLSEKFREIALDETRDFTDRHAAIFALGKLGGKENLDFLVKNIAVRINVRSRIGEFRARERTYYYALSNYTGWEAVPPVLRQLRHYEPPEEGKHNWALSSAARLLQGRLGREVARALIESELSRATEELHRENLQEVLREIR